MKLHILLVLVTLHSASLPCLESKALHGFVHSGPVWSELKPSMLPLMVRLGEEYFIRLNNPNLYQHVPPEKSFSARVNATRHALQLRLTQQSLLRGHIDDTEVGAGLTNSFTEQSNSEKKRRSEDPPISLDLTFHLLREMLQMARAEQLAQQANSNRRIMEFFGK